MSNKRKKHEYKCHICGSSKLAYQKEVRCLTPVTVTNNRQINYDHAGTINTGKYFKSTAMFCCLECDVKLVYNNRCVRTKKELLNYLENYSDNYTEPVSEDQQHVPNLMDIVERDGFITTKSEKTK